MIRSSIHPTAIIHPKAELGEGVVVGPYTVVGQGVTVGDGTILHNHVTLQGPMTLGRDNEVFPYAVLGAEPQDLKYQGLDTGLIIGDRNKIREHCTIHRGTELGGSFTRIGSDCLFMVAVHIAHDCTVEDQVVIANNTMLGGHCLVELGAIIAGGVGIHHYSTVGTLSFVAGMSRVTRDVPPFTLVEGQPAEVRKLNTTALNRRGWDAQRIEQLKDTYRELFRPSDEHAPPMAETIANLRATNQLSEDAHRLIQALEASQRGTYGRALDRPAT
ncbi:MAG: acyl-ACP--UDP-N-acetylglucosamine O-acyltransferase [Phycisphaerales bacterium]